jgi:hypothetical protein
LFPNTSSDFFGGQTCGSSLFVALCWPGSEAQPLPLIFR